MVALRTPYAACCNAPACQGAKPAAVSRRRVQRELLGGRHGEAWWGARPPPAPPPPPPQVPPPPTRSVTERQIPVQLSLVTVASLLASRPQLRRKHLEHPGRGETRSYLWQTALPDNEPSLATKAAQASH
jgi:hypothetical protein